MYKYSIRSAFSAGILVEGGRVSTNASGDDYGDAVFTGRITEVHYGTGRLYIMRDDGVTGCGNGGSWYVSNTCDGDITILDETDTTTKTKKSKLEVDKLIKESVADIKGFVKENRYVLYWVSLILLADHFIFDGSMREKIQGLFNSIIDKVNATINGEVKSDSKY